MKVLIGAAAATVLMVAAAMAQTTGTTTTTTTTTTTAPSASTTTPPGPPAVSRCGDLPADPTLPDGAHANAAAMEAGNTAYQAWGVAYQQVLTCRRQEFLEVTGKLESLRLQFNTGAEHLNTASAAWQASANTFNERQHPPRRH